MRCLPLLVAVAVLSGCTSAPPRAAAVVTVTGGMAFGFIERGVALRGASVIVQECESTMLAMPTAVGGEVAISVAMVGGEVYVGATGFRQGGPADACPRPMSARQILREGVRALDVPPVVVGAWVTVTPLRGMLPAIRAAEAVSSARAGG